MKTAFEVGKRLVELCNEGKNHQAMEELYAKDIVNLEAFAPGQETRGVAVFQKGKEWMESHTVHSAKHEGPWPHGDRFVVRFTYDATDKKLGKRMTMDEVGLFTVANGKIVREEYFYPTGP